jgi:hypothetical protein
MKKSKTPALACLFLFIWLNACNQQNKKDETSQAQQNMAAQLDSLEKIVANTAQRFHSYNNDTLTKILLVESAKQKEPFNSLAYRELRTRKDVNADTLSVLVKRGNNGAALLPLLLLREQNDKAYKSLPLELKAKVLTDALGASKMYNTWGFPPFHLEDAALAMIECGKATYPALKQMLTDTTAAPVFGSKEHMLYLRYKYRRCDYALFFIRKSEDPKFVFPTLLAQRDSLIRGALR